MIFLIEWTPKTMVNFIFCLSKEEKCRDNFIVLKQREYFFKLSKFTVNRIEIVFFFKIEQYFDFS